MCVMLVEKYNKWKHDRNISRLYKNLWKIIDILLVEAYQFKNTHDKKYLIEIEKCIDQIEHSIQTFKSQHNIK